MGKIRASAMHAQANTTEHGESWILCIASSYALFLVIFYVIRNVNGRCRYFCELWLCIVCRSTFRPVRLLQHSLPLFSKRTSTMPHHAAPCWSSLYRINQLISFFTVKLLSAALLLLCEVCETMVFSSLFSLRSCVSVWVPAPMHSLLYTKQDACKHFLSLPFWCYAKIYENIFLPQWTSCTIDRNVHETRIPKRGLVLL